MNRSRFRASQKSKTSARVKIAAAPFDVTYAIATGGRGLAPPPRTRRESLDCEQRLLALTPCSREPNKMSTPRTTRRTILHVDDDPAFLRSVAKLLATHDFEVVGVGNAEDALQQLSALGVR